MPTTSNFGWTTPADTDLVKDGAAAIRTLGNGIDTSLLDLKGGTSGQVLSKNSNTDLDYTWVTPNVGDITEVQAGTGISVASGTGPIPVITNTATTTIDAEGDLLVGDAADALQRLAIGSTGNVLTVDTAVDGKIKWAAPASGAMTLITRSTFSNVAGTNIDSVFSSTYKTYLVNVEKIYGATGADDFYFQFRYAGPTTQTASYYGNHGRLDPNSASLSVVQISNASQFTISTVIGESTFDQGCQFYVNNCGNASEKASISGLGMMSGFYNYGTLFTGMVDVARTYTGFRLSSSSSNITGVVSVYGLGTV